MIKEFRDFLAQRNMLDLAVGVIIGGASTTIIKSFVDNIINPLIGMFVNAAALRSLTFQIGSAKFYYGTFLNDVLNFLLTAVIVFLLIKFIKAAIPTKEPEEKVDERLDTLKEIRDLLKKEAN